MIDTLAVAGRPAECEAALGRFAEAGLDVPIAILSPGPPMAEQIAALRDTLAPAWLAVTGRHRQPTTAPGIRDA